METNPESACVQALAQLVAFDSTNPTGAEGPIVEYLRQRLARLNPSDLAVTHAKGAEGRPTSAVYARWGVPRVLINAHLDTVAVTEGWLADPFRLRIDGDRLIGLGTADIKGAIAAALVALEQQPGGPRDCAVLFSGDEEQTNACMPAFLATPQARDLHSVIVCEPTDLKVGHCHRGLWVFEVGVQGQGGHSCYADTLPAPIGELCRVGVALQAWAGPAAADSAPEFAGLCLNLANIRGGTDYNIVPNSAKLLVSIRPSPGLDMAALRAGAKASIAQVAPRATVEDKLVLPPFLTARVDAFRPHFGTLCDKPVPLGFWTEASMWTAAGANAVVYGPGHMPHAHAAEEFVSQADLVAASQLFARILAAP